MSYFYTMYTMQQAYYHLSRSLTGVYDEREASAIAHEYMGHLTGLDRTSRLIHKDQPLTSEQQVVFEAAVASLVRAVPLQYVTHSAWFMGREFFVDERVLIPRPETEELVNRVVAFCAPLTGPLSILDMGTGSGCIAVSLSARVRGAGIVAVDKSRGALEVAQKNAAGLAIRFLEVDFLDDAQRDTLPVFDVIVSNPPYIPVCKREEMHTNVKDHEPALALFVANDNPLLFYRAIAEFGKTHLAPGGAIFCELEQSMATQCLEMFKAMGYPHAQVHKDMHGNDRMLEASR